MTRNTLIYKPPAKRSIVIAFAAAIMIHICAVALASHHALPAPEPPMIITGEITGTEERDATPAPSEIEFPPPLPPPSFNTEFVEEKSPIRRDPRPVRPVAKARSGAVTNARVLALHAPRPEYPYEARRRQITGSGVIALTVDEASGAVINAEMEQSIGNSILDQSALSALRRWRFRNGTPGRVRVPVTFTITGAQL